MFLHFETSIPERSRLSKRGALAVEKKLEQFSPSFKVPDGDHQCKPSLLQPEGA
jgi:hypothetical protein